MADLEKTVKAAAKSLKESKTEAAGVADAIKLLNIHLKNTEKSTDKVHDRFQKLKKEAGEFADDLKDNSKASTAMAGAFQKSGSHFKNMWGALKSGNFKVMGEAANDAKEFAISTKVGAGATAKMGGFIGMAGKAVRGLATGLGGVSKVLAGPVGIAAMVGIAVVKGAIAIDKYIKDMNKSFALVRGPDIMTGDVNKQFKEFNLAIVSAGDNIRDGLNSQDVMSFFEAMNASGQSVASVSKGLYSYRHVIDIAAKASKIFGVEMAATGAFMSNMMINQRLNVQDLDDAFVSMAFSASKSGLSTDKFWNAVTNATASLAFYGKFVKEIGKTMGDFTATQVAGADETIQLVGDMSQIFKKASYGTNLALLRLSGGGDKMFADIAEKAKAAAEEAGKNVVNLELLYPEDTRTPEQLAEIDKAVQEQVSLQGQARRAQESAVGGETAQALDMAAASDQSNAILMRILKRNIAGNLSSDKYSAQFQAQLEALSQTSKALTPEMVKTLIEINRHNSDAVISGLEDSGKIVARLTTLQKDFGDSALSDAGQEDSLDKTTELLAGIFGNSVAAKNLAIAAIKSPIVADLVSKLTQGSAEDKAAVVGQLKNMAAGNVQGYDMAFDISQHQEKITKKTTAKQRVQYNKQFEQIRNATLSIADMVDIASTDAKYRLATIAQFDKISSGVTKLVNFILGSKTADKATEAADKTADALTKAEKNSENWTTKFDSIDKASKSNVEATREYHRLEKKGKRSEAENEAFALLKSTLKFDSAGNVIDNSQLKILQKDYQLQVKKAADEVERHKITLGVLQGMSDKDDKQLKIMLADPKIQKQLYQAMQGMDVEEATSTFGPALEKAGEKFGEKVDIGGGQKAFSAMRMRGTGKGAAFSTADVTNLDPDTGKPITGHAKGGIVTRPTIAQIGEAGPEAIIPLKKSSPIFTTGPGAGAPAGTAGKSITINVNATTKDLAQAIANAVRGELYKAQVTGG